MQMRKKKLFLKSFLVRIISHEIHNKNTPLYLHFLHHNNNDFLLLQLQLYVQFYFIFLAILLVLYIFSLH